MAKKDRVNSLKEVQTKLVLKQEYDLAGQIRDTWKDMEKENKLIINSTIMGCVGMFLIGLTCGCFIISFGNREAITHYRQCQEQQLLKTNAELRDEKSWYIKEDAFGKLKIVQMSNRELDSLSK